MTRAHVLPAAVAAYLLSVAPCFAQSAGGAPGDTSGPAAGKAVEPSTAVQKTNPHMEPGEASGASAGSPGVEGLPGSESGPPQGRVATPAPGWVGQRPGDALMDSTTGVYPPEPAREMAPPPPPPPAPVPRPQEGRMQPPLGSEAFTPPPPPPSSKPVPAPAADLKWLPPAEIAPHARGAAPPTPLADKGSQGSAPPPKPSSDVKWVSPPR